VGVGKPHPLAGKTVHVGGRDFRGRILADRIAIAHIVGHHEHDIGMAGFRFGAERSRAQAAHGQSSNA
jgi:hypothetical protein